MNALTGTIRIIMEGIDPPVIVLLAMLATGAYVMFKAQQRDDFDWAEMLRDENGKPSAFRLAIFVCLGVSSWLLIYLSMRIITTSVTWAEALGALFPWYALYTLTWSGAKIAEKLVDIVLAKVGVQPRQAPTAPQPVPGQPP